MTIEPVEVPLEADMRLAEAALQFEKDRGDQLRAALVSNRRIGVAVGLVMAQSGVSDVLALESLRQASMRSNRRLADLAEDVISLRKLTPVPPGVATP